MISALRFVRFKGASVNDLANCLATVRIAKCMISYRWPIQSILSLPYLMSSPHPPHLNCPSGGWRGNVPQAHCFNIPAEHPRATTRVNAAEASAYTQACSLVPYEKQTIITVLKCNFERNMASNLGIGRASSAVGNRPSYNSTCGRQRLVDRPDCRIGPPPKRRASMQAAANRF